jgi:uncharacterized membrane protein
MNVAVGRETATRAIDAGQARFAALKHRWMQNDGLRHLLPQALLIALMVLYFFTFERLVWARHVHFNTYDYDLGLNSQASWLLANGRGFMTTRGMQVFGHHFSPGYLLFAPAYWLGAGAQFLGVVNTAAITLGAVPLYALGRHHLKSDWFGLGIATAYLFHFLPQWLIWESFHPENIAMPALFAAFYFATTRRWRWYWVAVVFALLWKEDVALVVVMLGIFVFFFFKNRRVGALTFAAGATWFLIATKLIQPYFSPAGAVYDSLFGPLGSSGTDVVLNSVRHPAVVARTLGNNGAEGGAYALIRAYGFVPLGGAVVFMLGIPQTVIDFLSVEAFTRDPRTHYFTLPFVAITLAATWVLGNRRRASIAWVLLFVMLIGVAATKNEGVGPWTFNSTKGFWPQHDTPVQDDLREALRLIPAEAGVSANDFLVPHLSERPQIYTFPNPWKSSYYGPGGKDLRGDESAVDYLIVKTDVFNEQDTALFSQIRDSGEFEVIYDKDPVYVLRRRTG